MFAFTETVVQEISNKSIKFLLDCYLRQTRSVSGLFVSIGGNNDAAPDKKDSARSELVLRNNMTRLIPEVVVKKKQA
jgi:hypothetical protein